MGFEIFALKPVRRFFPRTLNINARGIVRVSQAVAKNMIDAGIKGSIVNVSSTISEVRTATGHVTRGVPITLRHYCSREKKRTVIIINIRPSRAFIVAGQRRALSILSENNRIVDSLLRKKKALITPSIISTHRTVRPNSTTPAFGVISRNARRMANSFRIARHVRRCIRIE